MFEQMTFDDFLPQYEYVEKLMLEVVQCWPKQYPFRNWDWRFLEYEGVVYDTNEVYYA